MRMFATADMHFGHGNIIKYANRPYRNADEMNRKLIDNWNMRVKPEDLVFHVGDWCFRTDKLTQAQLGGVGKEKANYWASKLNGNIIFIKGNHDQNNSLKTYIDSVDITYANKRIRLVHKPEHADPTKDINVVGHVHNRFKIRTFKEYYDIIEKIQSEAVASDRQDWDNFLKVREPHRYSESIIINCGVDVQQYRPATMDELLGQCIRYQKGIIE